MVLLPTLVIPTQGQSFIYRPLNSDHLKANIILHVITKYPWMYFYKKNIAFQNKTTVPFLHKSLWLSLFTFKCTDSRFLLLPTLCFWFDPGSQQLRRYGYLSISWILCFLSYESLSNLGYLKFCEMNFDYLHFGGLFLEFSLHQHPSKS